MTSFPPLKATSWRRLASGRLLSFEILESRVLLTQAFPLDLADAIPLNLTPSASVNGTVAPGVPLLFKITPEVSGLLTAMAHSVGVEAQLSLLDANGNVLVQSDGQSAGNPDPRIEQHLPSGAGDDYLEVESLEGVGNATLTASLTATSDPFSTIPTSTLSESIAPVVVGDFTNDGKLDYIDESGVHLGAGGGVFLPVVPGTSLISPDGESPVAIITGAFSGPGSTDLAVAYEYSSLVNILQVNANGTFHTLATLTSVTAPVSLAAGDFEDDGRTDLAVADASSHVVTIFEDNASGNFQAVNQITLDLAGPSMIVAGDFGGEGLTDLAVAYFGQVTFLLNQGPGVPFQSVTSPIAFTSIVGIAAGDFNGKGHDGLAVADAGVGPGYGSVTILQVAGNITVAGVLPNRFNSSLFSIAAVDLRDDADHTDLAVSEMGQSLNSGDVAILLNNGNGSFHSAGTVASGLQTGQVASGNFTPDGNTDLIVAAFYNGDSTILLGNGQGALIPAPPVGVTPLAVGDFNGDGILDYVAADGVHLGTGDGSFRTPLAESSLSNFVDDPSAVVAGDFRGNGQTELAVTSLVDNDVTILQVNADGSLSLVGKPIPTGLFPVAITTGDFSGDGKTDLAVADFGSNNVTILMGHGDGTFSAGKVVQVGLEPISIAAGDFNGDGKTDLAVADSLSNDVTILDGLGDGSFRFAQRVPVGQDPVAIVAGDFRGDGEADLAVADYGTIPLSGDVRILLDGPGGQFTALPPASQLASNPKELVTGDFNGDGKTDLAVGDSFSNDVTVLQSNGDGTFHVVSTAALGRAPYALGAGDFNGNGRTDLITLGENDTSVEVIPGNGNGTFREAGQDPVGIEPNEIASGDFNGDGSTDLAVLDQYSQDVTILLGNGDGTFRKGAVIPVAGGPIAITAGDFNGDGLIDLAVANYNANTVTILLGNGDGTFKVTGTYPVGANPSAIVEGDFTGNGKTDLAVADFGSNDVTVLLGHGDGTFQTLSAAQTGGPKLANALTYAQPIALATGDFDGKGRTELAVACYAADSVLILKVSDDQTISLVSPPIVFAANCTAVAAGVFSGNGVTDLAVATDDGNLTILMGHGDGTFEDPADATQYPLDSYTYEITTGDFNGDGATDLAVGYFDVSETTVFMGEGNGQFQAMQQMLPSGDGDVLWVAAVDLNNDGRDDLAFTLENPSQIAVLLSLGEGAFADAVNATTSNVPVFADLNGDGTPDVAIVNSAGNILVRDGKAGEPGSFDPPFIANLGNPSRGIAAIPFSQGVLLASVDVRGNAVTLYFFDKSKNNFEPVGSFATGNLPAQIVAGDLDGNGQIELVVRNAGDGTLSVFYPDLAAPAQLIGGSLVSIPAYHAMLPILVGTGVADVSLTADQTTGRLDLLLADSGAGEVRVIRNQGNGQFGPAEVFRAGNGPYGPDDDPSDSPRVISLEATSGVTSGVTTADGLDDLIAINPGSNTLSVLDALGDGRFANPTVLDTSQPALEARAVDFSGNGDGPAGLVVLDANGLEIFTNNGQGFSPEPTVVDTGFEPTGFAVADINGDGKPDLLIGNQLGDVLALVGQGDGTFAPPTSAKNQVSLAVGSTTNGGVRSFFFAEQGSHSLVMVQHGVQVAAVQIPSENFTPGAVQLAKLNGGSTPYLIVANSGGNNVLVYPVLPSGFGPELNGGQGIATGTNPVGITVADVNGDGRLDLVVADKGSNDVDILLNQPVGNGFTFTQALRLKTGEGPTATVVSDIDGTGFPDILVSDSGSNNVLMFKGVGFGYFDTTPIAFPTGDDPGPLFVGNFSDIPGQLDLVTLNAGSNDLTLISDINGAHVSFQTINSDGIEPIAGVEGEIGGVANGLLIANGGSGNLVLFLAGSAGLQPYGSVDFDGEHPSALATDSFGNVFVAFEGRESAVLVTLGLGASGSLVGGDLGATRSNDQQVALLQPLGEVSLGLVATILSVPTESTQSEAPALPNQPLTPNAPPFSPDEFDVAQDQTEEAPPDESPNPASEVEGRQDRLVLFIAGANEAIEQARLDGGREASPGGNGSPRYPWRSSRALDELLAASWSPVIKTAGGLTTAASVRLLRLGISAADFVDDLMHRPAPPPPRPATNPPHTSRSAVPIGLISLGLAALALPVGDLVRPGRDRISQDR